MKWFTSFFGNSSSSPPPSLELYFAKPTDSLLRQLVHSVLDRAELIQNLERKKSDSAAYKRFKQAVTQAGNWKVAILSLRIRAAFSHHRVTLHYPNALENEITLGNRVQTFQDGDFYSAFGSTFSTNKKERLQDHDDVTLDAAYGMELEDGSKVMALGDGSGGHLDAQEDRAISRAAHFATKMACRLLAAYSSPDELKKDLPRLMDFVCQEIRHKAALSNTTLAVFRIFQEAKGCRVIGWNVGDNLLYGWDPKKREGVSLSGALRVGEVTALMCKGGYREGEVDLVDQRIESGLHLFLMSDGVHDALPHEEVLSQDALGADRAIRKLVSLDSSFKGGGTLEENVHVLASMVIAAGERDRMSASQEVRTQIGDDFSLVATVVSRSK